jgi:hypothetical protein
MDAVALDSSQIGKLGVVITIALVVVGVLLGLVITALVGRVIIVIVVVGLSALVWQQRATIQDHVKKCDLDMSFLGVHINAPKDVVEKCQT